MPQTEISQTSFQPTLEGLGNAPYIVFWYTGQNFIAGDGTTPVIVGDGQTTGFKLRVTCSIVSDRLVAPALGLWATTDGQPATSRFFGQLYSEDGAPRDMLFGGASGWQLPTIYGAVISYDQLMRYNRAAYLLAPPPAYFTQEQTIAEILRLAGVQNYAGFDILGRTELSFAPDDAAIPIAIGNNDPRGIDISSYATFAAMIAAVGATPTTFNIHTNISVPTSATVPSTLTLRFLQGGRVTITTGQTLTIQGPIIADPVKIFYNATAGLGTVSFSGNSSLWNIYPQWWGAVGDDSTDCAAAFQAMLAVNWYNGSLRGARFCVPSGIYRIGTGLIYRGSFSHSFVLFGSNQGEGGTSDSATLKYTGASGGTLFQMLGANWCRVEDIQFDGNGLALRDLVIDYDSSRAQGSFDCEVDHCNFGGVTGVNSALLVLGTSNFASAEHLVQNSRFIYLSVVGSTYYGVVNFGSANAKDYTIRSCDFIGLRYGVALGNSGYHEINGCSFAGQTIADVLPGGAQTSINNFSSEGSAMLVDGSGLSGTVAGSLSISDGYFAGSGNAGGYVVDFRGKLTVKGAAFGAGPTLGAIPPKFKVNINGSTGGGVVSENNFYDWDAATADDFIPFYDTSDQLLGTLAVSGIDSDLFSTGDGAHNSGGLVGFPTWSIQGNIGVHPKTILAAFWGSANTYNIAFGDSILLTECAAGPFGTGYNVIGIATPAAAGKGKRHLIVKTDSSAVPIAVSNGFAANIQGGLGRIMLTGKDDFVEVESDGVVWRIIRYRISEFTGQLTISGAGTVTYTWKNEFITAPTVVATDTNATPAVVGASSTTTVLTLTGTAGRVVNYRATFQ